jgi:hypothetical protein
MSYVRKAKVYRAHRLNPIPFRSHAKVPAFEEGEIQGYRGRRATDAELEQLFADDGLNIGVLTGNGHVVLDIDGADGCHSIKGLPMPDTPTVLTGADGDESHFHAHFRTTERLRTKIRPLPGLDILGEDWQVLMPELVVFEIWIFTLTCGMLIPSSGGRCHGPDGCDVSVLSK